MELLLLLGGASALLVLAIIFLVSWDVRAKRVDPGQSFGKSLHHYLSVKALAILGSFFRRRLVRATTDVAHVQESFLLNQLRENAQTAYGKQYDFASVKTVEDFQRLHPLTKYENYAPYVERMMAGEENVLTKKQPDVFGVSSGTSGEGNKIIPMLKKQKGLFFLNAVSVLYCCLVEAFPASSAKLRKSLKIFYNPTWRTSKGGIKIGPNSSTPSSQKGLLHMYTTPEAGFEILSEPDALYVHILFALRDRHLGLIEGNFASLIYNTMTTLRRRLPEFLHDIEHGRLSGKLGNVDPSIRARLEKLLKPDPGRAKEIREAFEQGVAGVCRRIWPELCVVLTVDTGAFAPYAEKLRETFLQGVPLYSPVYAATEGLIGVNLWPTGGPSRYLPHPAVQFFEFIPMEKSELANPDTLLLHQLKEGKEYEVVLTNVSGLYRYRLGDVVKVTGFLNQCPIIDFQYRMGQFLNVRGEKTGESLFYSALSSAVDKWEGFTLVDYCCAESLLLDDLNNDEASNTAPCYHVFVELESTADGQEVTEDQTQMIDETLRQSSYVYSSFRKKGSIDAIQVHVLRRGAFQRMRDYVIQTTDASSNQFKVPRVIKHKGFVDFLLRD